MKALLLLWFTSCSQPASLPAEAPPPSAFVLHTSDFVATAPATVGGTGLPPGAVAQFYVDPSSRPPMCPPAIAPACAGISSSAIRVGQATANGGGTATLTFTVPPVAAGASLRVQAWALTGRQVWLSNVVRTTVGSPDPCGGDDADADGVCGPVDRCPDVADPGQADSDGDGLGDACDRCYLDADPDYDLDETCNDNCPYLPNGGQDDNDGDGLGDACDPCPYDPDADADAACPDNCPDTSNAGQEDADQDGVGDACDPCPYDLDGDLDGACPDNCPEHPNAGQEDYDADGLGDACDPCPYTAADSDGDGLCDHIDNCAALSNAEQNDQDGDGRGDACDPCPDDPGDDLDDDGRCADADNCPYIPNPGQLDLDRDGAGDACDSCAPPCTEAVTCRDAAGADVDCTTGCGATLCLDEHAAQVACPASAVDVCEGGEGPFTLQVTAGFGVNASVGVVLGPYLGGCSDSMCTWSTQGEVAITAEGNLCFQGCDTFGIELFLNVCRLNVGRDREVLISANPGGTCPAPTVAPAGGFVDPGVVPVPGASEVTITSLPGISVQYTNVTTEGSIGMAPGPDTRPEGYLFGTTFSLQSSATVAGETTVCVQGTEPNTRLFQEVAGSWTDITTSQGGGQTCGAAVDDGDDHTTSFSANTPSGSPCTGETPGTDADCDDGVFCTRDTCVQTPPSPDRPSTYKCVHSAQNEGYECGSLPCRGVSRCVSGSCTPGLLYPPGASCGECRECDGWGTCKPGGTGPPPTADQIHDVCKWGPSPPPGRTQPTRTRYTGSSWSDLGLGSSPPGGGDGCFLACGAQCPDSCAQTPVERCNTWYDVCGSPHKIKCQYNLRDCGWDDCCAVHDACFLTCDQVYPEHDTAWAVCWVACNLDALECADKYCILPGTDGCEYGVTALWANGYGPMEFPTGTANSMLFWEPSQTILPESTGRGTCGVASLPNNPPPP
jgi:hypothetical protein